VEIGCQIVVSSTIRGVHMERRLVVTGLLAALGAVVGAAAAPLLSFLATTVANASLPAGRVGYFFDPAAFAVVGATEVVPVF
jgi:hypothetical protein